LFVYIIGVAGLATTRQRSALHVATGWLIVIGLAGALVSVVCIETARNQFCARQLKWASVPLLSVGILAFVPFARLALIRRRARDWMVFAAYLAAVAAEAAFVVYAYEDVAAEKSFSVIVAGLVVIAPAHALLAFSPAAAAPSGHEARAAETGEEPILDAVVAADLRWAAVAGSWTAVLSGVAGFSSQVLFLTDYSPPVAAFGLAIYLILVAVGSAALVRINRLVIVGLLQGMCWPAVAYVATDVVSSSFDHMFGLSGRWLAGYWVGAFSDVLGACAAVLLVQSWSRALERRRRPGLRLSPVVLLGGVGLSQICAWIFYATHIRAHATANTLGVAGLLAGLALTWYALRLRANFLGGAIVLGWAASTALMFLASMFSWTASGSLGCILLVIVMITALSYMRGPSAIHRSHLPPDLGRGAVPTADSP
jgi:hypothetical protein